jgi:uncharacterized protein with FMN-binding domain
MSNKTVRVAAVAAAVLAGTICVGAASGGNPGGGNASGLVTGLASGLRDGSYEAAAKAKVPFGKIVMLPKIKVRVAVRDGLITGIELLSPSALAEDEKFLALGKRVVDSQSAEVDTISGATYSSSAFLAAVREAVSE